VALRMDAAGRRTGVEEMGLVLARRESSAPWLLTGVGARQQQRGGWPWRNGAAVSPWTWTSPRSAQGATTRREKGCLLQREEENRGVHGGCRGLG
jgi:hypothetical protein